LEGELLAPPPGAGLRFLGTDDDRHVHGALLAADWTCTPSVYQQRPRLSRSV